MNLNNTEFIKVINNNDEDITKSLIDNNKISYTINDIGQSKLVKKIDLNVAGEYEVTYSISGYSKKLIMKVKVE